MVNFQQVVPKPFNGERTVSSTNGAGTSGCLYTKDGLWGPISCNKEKLTQNEPKTYGEELKLQQLGENVRTNLHGVGFGNGFLSMTTHAQAMNGKNI